MTVDPRTTESIGEAYLATYRGPHGGTPDPDATDTGPLVALAVAIVMRMAVVGTGALGRHHARILSELPDVELVAVAEQDQARCRIQRCQQTVGEHQVEHRGDDVAVQPWRRSLAILRKTVLILRPQPVDHEAVAPPATHVTGPDS